jgi:hemerythrin superfamily protein
MLHDSYPTQGDKCNVLIFRLSHPWLSSGEVNEGRLNETLEVARSYLGQELIVIFQTAAFNNNVVTSEDLINFRAMNGVVRSFVTKLNASDVLLSDVELYMDNVIEWNAKQLGMDTTNATLKDVVLEDPTMT